MPNWPDSNNTLNKIVANKKLEIAEKKKSFPQYDLEKSIVPGNGSFKQVLQKPGLKIIAEMKPQSPSAGTLCQDFDPDQIIQVYNKYATAISVLTDEKFFGGSFNLLAKAAQQSTLPVLCKDFIIDQYQCLLARHFGAQAILLIAKILPDQKLNDLYQQTLKLGMTAVLEVQNEAELARAISLKPQPEVILINNRNLEDFTINLHTTKNLASHIPKGSIAISASGIESRNDVQELIPFCTNFLIGSSFMRSADIKKAFQDLFSLSPSVSGIKN